MHPRHAPHPTAEGPPTAGHRATGRDGRAQGAQRPSTTGATGGLRTTGILRWRTVHTIPPSSAARAGAPTRPP